MSRLSRAKRTRTLTIGRAINCSKCGISGGTMVKDGSGGYKHIGKDERCKLLQMRNRVTKP